MICGTRSCSIIENARINSQTNWYGRPLPLTLLKSFTSPLQRESVDRTDYSLPICRRYQACMSWIIKILKINESIRLRLRSEPRALRSFVNGFKAPKRHFENMLFVKNFFLYIWMYHIQSQWLWNHFCFSKYIWRMK